MFYYVISNLDRLTEPILTDRVLRRPVRCARPLFAYHVALALGGRRLCGRGHAAEAAVGRCDGATR